MMGWYGDRMGLPGWLGMGVPWLALLGLFDLQAGQAQGPALVSAQGNRT